MARCGTPNSSSTWAAFPMTDQSESEPMKMTTEGFDESRGIGESYQLSALSSRAIEASSSSGEEASRARTLAIGSSATSR